MITALVSIGNKNILLIEIYKTFSGENPHFMKSIFTKKDVNIQSKNIKSLKRNQNKYKKIWPLLFFFVPVTYGISYLTI